MKSRVKFATLEDWYCKICRPGTCLYHSILQCCIIMKSSVKFATLSSKKMGTILQNLLPPVHAPCISFNSSAIRYNKGIARHIWHHFMLKKRVLQNWPLPKICRLVICHVIFEYCRIMEANFFLTIMKIGIWGACLWYLRLNTGWSI